MIWYADESRLTEAVIRIETSIATVEMCCSRLLLTRERMLALGLCTHEIELRLREFDESIDRLRITHRGLLRRQRGRVDDAAWTTTIRGCA